MILNTRYESNPKATVCNGSEKFMSGKIHVLQKASAAKLYSAFVDILRNNEISLFYLIAERRILPYCFCQQSH